MLILMMAKWTCRRLNPLTPAVASECPDVKNYKWWLNTVWHKMLYSCTHMTTVGVKGLILGWLYCSTGRWHVSDVTSYSRFIVTLALVCTVSEVCFYHKSVLLSAIMGRPIVESVNTNYVKKNSYKKLHSAVVTLRYSPAAPQSSDNVKPNAKSKKGFLLSSNVFSFGGINLFANGVIANFVRIFSKFRIILQIWD